MRQTMKTAMAALLMAAASVAAMGQTAVKATFVNGSGPDSRNRESADKVADGRKSTKWCMDDPRQMPYFVVLSVGEQPVALQEYVFTTGDDTNMYPDRNPCSWVVYGSNDQKDWKIVAEEHSKNVNTEACEAVEQWFLSEEAQKLILEGFMHSVFKGMKEIPQGSIDTEELIGKDLGVDWENAYHNREAINTAWTEIVTTK